MFARRRTRTPPELRVTYRRLAAGANLSTRLEPFISRIIPPSTFSGCDFSRLDGDIKSKGWSDEAVLPEGICGQDQGV
jgi:hypothetical protein